MVALTDSTGSVLFSPVENGRYQVRVVHSPHGIEFLPDSQSVNVPHGKSATTTFHGEWTVGSVVGRVTVGGDPQAKIDMQLHGPTSRYVQTSESGHFIFSDLPLGDYVLSLMRVRPEWEFPDTAVATTVTGGGVTSVEFSGTQRPWGILTGTVFIDEDGDMEYDPGEPKPADFGIGYRGTGSWGGSNFSRVGGTYTLRRMDAGTYTLWVEDEPAGYAVHPAYGENVSISVDWGETVHVDLPLVPGVSNHIRASSGSEQILTLSERVSLAIRTGALPVDTLVTLIPTSVEVDLITIPVLEIHPKGLALSVDATFRFSPPAGVQFPAGSTVWHFNELTGSYQTVPTTMVVEGIEVTTAISSFKDYLVPFLSDPAFWPELGDWFLPAPG